MAQCTPLILRIVASSVSVAGQAGKIIRDVMKKGELGIIDKGVNDLQTEADRSAQNFIISTLTKQFPGVTIIGEEEPSCYEALDNVTADSDTSVLQATCPPDLVAVSEKDVVIWVDPLDGTSEYTKGLLDHVTVLIGIAVGQRAIAGVIHQPFHNFKLCDENKIGRTIWGLQGYGVAGFKPIPPPSNKRIITTTRSHFTPEIQETLDAMCPDELLRVGGAGHKVILLMEGKAHAYVFASPGCKRWDTCAPEAVLRAMGGELTDMHGATYDYSKDTPHANTRGVLATALASDHEFYLKMVPQKIRELLI
nr:PREDICTED: 3'(2'),5'-bisphosphate nucleotidase 1 [Bemisia tabaci]